MTAILWIRTRANAPLNTFAPMDVLSASMAALATQLEPDVTVLPATRAPTAKLVSACTCTCWCTLYLLVHEQGKYVDENKFHSNLNG